MRNTTADDGPWLHRGAGGPVKGTGRMAGRGVGPGGFPGMRGSGPTHAQAGLSSPSITRPARKGQAEYKRERVDLTRLKIESGHWVGPLQSVSCTCGGDGGRAVQGQVRGGIGRLGVRCTGSVLTMSYVCFFSSSDRTSYAAEHILNFSSAAVSPLFLSGWYFIAFLR